MEIEEILEAPQRVRSRSRSPFSDEDSQEEKFSQNSPSQIIQIQEQ